MTLKSTRITDTRSGMYRQDRALRLHSPEANRHGISRGLTKSRQPQSLGCHCSNVAKLIRKGDLTSTGKRGASLSREQVEAVG